jgi:hypothetical protein
MTPLFESFATLDALRGDAVFLAALAAAAGFTGAGASLTGSGNGCSGSEDGALITSGPFAAISCSIRTWFRIEAAIASP